MTGRRRLGAVSTGWPAGTLLAAPRPYYNIKLPRSPGRAPGFRPPGIRSPPRRGARRADFFSLLPVCIEPGRVLSCAAPVGWSLRFASPPPWPPSFANREPSAGLVPIGLGFFSVHYVKGVQMESRQAFGTLLEEEVLAPVAVMSGDDEDEYVEELVKGDDLDEEDEDFDPDLDDDDFLEDDDEDEA